MKFCNLLRISFSVLLSLALLGASHGRQYEWTSDEDYWQSIWPNTPIPNILKVFLKTDIEDSENYVGMKADDKLYQETFFLDKDFYPGKSMNFHFINIPNGAQPYGVRIWRKDEKANNVGLNFYKDVCKRSPASKGEHKYCAQSLRSMIDFAVSKLGKDIHALSSSFLDKHDDNRYTIQGAQSLGDRAVMCHMLNFRKVTFYCHVIHETTAYLVPLTAADGTKTNALAVCHHETSGMNSELLYELLKVKPGTCTVCHDIVNKSVMWLPNKSGGGDSGYIANVAA